MIFPFSRIQQCCFPRLFGRLALVASVFCVLVNSASSYEVRFVNGPEGKPLFELRFFDQGERYNDPDEGGYENVSTWQLGSEQKNTVVYALSLWAEVLEPGSRNTAPVPINVGTYDDQNADAIFTFDDTQAGKDGFTRAAGSIILNETPQMAEQIRIGTFDFGIPSHLSPLPSTGKVDFIAVLYHEVGHTLGIGSLVDNIISDDEEAPVFQVKTPSLWDKHLYDQYGTRLTESMYVFMEGTEGTPGKDFIVGDYTQSGVAFRGEHVTEVLGGALDNRLTVEGFEIYGQDLETGRLLWFPELSHIELERGLMSHQNYRNTVSFMEAELAVLQDIGYDIDRRNFFGFSVYGDGGTLTNDNGFFARDKTGNCYLQGLANTATLGVGLHLYGKNNDVTQAADLLAGGTAGTGIRVDGSGNTLRIAPNVRVAADGDWGTGILVSYGKNQTIISRGDVQAMGIGGIGARFDFGNNVLSNDAEYRGSWIWQDSGSTRDISCGVDNNGFLLNLDGPLIKRFDVSGILTGTAAAVYISENAYVGEINIMQGARLYGDIVSLWDPENPFIQYAEITGGANAELTTVLRFGRMAANDGSSTDAADPDFILRYDGNILGGKSISLKVEGGYLYFNGRGEVLDVEVKGNAVLGGNADYVLSTGGCFTNQGTLSPGNGPGGIHISGDYVQTSTGDLKAGFDASGRISGITVSGSASLDGTLTVEPAPGYYRATLNFNLTDIVSAEGPLSGPGLFPPSVITTGSPTLQMTLFSSGEGRDTLYTVTPFRAGDAYSRFAGDDSQREVAYALDRLGQADVEGDTRLLMAALDFSAPDGSQLPGAYAQLGPDIYNRAAEAGLSAQRGMSAILQDTRLTVAPSLNNGETTGERRFFLTPLGGSAHYDGSRGWNGNYGGLLAGADSDRPAGNGLLSLGVHAAVIYREETFSGTGVNRARTGGFFAGGHGRYTFSSLPGAYLFNQIRAGLESTDLRRSVNFLDYARRAKSDWVMPSGTFLAGGGWDFHPSNALTLGPVAWLDYSAGWRPPVTERDGGAIDLRMDDQYFQSLRSTVGGRISTSVPMGRQSLEVNLTAAWNHEFLQDYGRARGCFADYGDVAFARTGTVRDLDTLGVSMNLVFRISEAYSLSLTGGTDTGRNSNASWGGVQYQWRF